MSLTRYHEKRDFRRTPEPRGGRPRRAARRAGLYIVHKHDATRLHYDLRLEHRGVLLSWAVPKGIPTVTGAKALAVRTEDHPLEYGSFEGVIPQGQYGGGTVMLWDRGHWEPEGDVARGLREGKLSFRIEGVKLRGRWTLVRTAGRTSGRSGKENWLIIKRSSPDDAAAPTSDLDRGSGLDRSADTGRTMEEIAGSADRTWSSARGEVGRPQADGDPIERACAQLPGARRARQPTTLRPQLATLSAHVPAEEGWLHEIKLDGYRMLAFKDGARVRLRSRNDKDWTRSFGAVVEAVAAVPVERAILDGELVVLRPDGRSDFQALQSALDGRARTRYVYFVFDLPFCAGYDLTEVPLIARKEVLARLFAVGGERAVLRFSDHVVGQGQEFFRQACSQGLEGIMSKRADARYVQARTRTWLKAKCAQEQEFIIGGWTDPAGSRTNFGSLLIGRRDERGELDYCGRVGTGFDQRRLESIARALAPLAVDRSPFVDPPRGAAARGVHWVAPELACRVSFTEWTRDGIVRHPTFLGLVPRRPDRPRRAAGRRAAPVAKTERTPARAGQTERVAEVRITHPDRVVYPADGLTKLDVARYCEAVAERMLPHVVRRPLTLVRCPEGAGGQCFYQKHARAGFPEAIRSIRIPEKDGSGLYVWIDDVEGLVSLVQFGVLEIHPWGSRIDRLDHPDRIVIDLDPDPSVPWERVVGTAHAVRDVLEQLGLRSFARTTGGKGLHVVFPIERRATWDDAKGFAADLVELFARQAPGDYVTTAGKEQRKGRIYLDYLRNDRGATAIASYCMRAREGAPVATPIAWDELTADLDPSRFAVTTLPRRLAELAVDPWADFFETRQSLSRSVRSALRDVARRGR